MLQRWIGRLLGGLIFVSLCSGAQAIDLGPTKYDVYYGDLDGDGQANDVYFYGKEIFVPIHGDILIPLFIRPESYAFYDVLSDQDLLLGSPYDAQAVALTLTETEVAALTPAILGTDFQYADYNGDGAADILLVGNQGEMSIDSPPNPALATQPSYPTASDEVGSMEGNFRVNETGAATYNIPIMAVAGTAGVAPSLSFDYSSQGGNGLLGLGWSLSGLSEITRCRQTYQQDLNPLTINWTDTDRFCLDGQRLLLIEGSDYGVDNSVYRTEVDSMVEVTLRTGSDGQPDYFDVRRKDGSTSRYGWVNTDDAGHSEFKPELLDGNPGNDILRWSIRRIVDNVGNEMHFFYDNNPRTGHRITSIRYAYGANLGGTGASGYGAETLFNYEDRADQKNAYISGRRMNLSKRLTEVVVKNNEQVLRRYNLDYVSPTGMTVPGDETTRLWAIEECASNGKCLPPTSFAWDLHPAIKTLSVADDAGRLDLSYASTSSLYTQAFLDINGDGYQDVAWLQFVTQDTPRFNLDYAIYNPDEQSLDPGSTVTTLSTSDLDNSTLHVLDYNVDGRMDLALWRDDLNELEIFLATPRDSGTGWRLKRKPGRSDDPFTGITEKPDFIDINADGLVDMVVGEQVYLLKRNPAEALESNQLYHYVAASLDFEDINLQEAGIFDTPNYWIAKQNEQLVQSLGDVNGDGIIDYLVRATVQVTTEPPPCRFCLRNTWEYFVATIKEDVNAGTDAFHVKYLIHVPDVSNSSTDVSVSHGDINGDGLSDFIIQDKSDDKDRWKIFFSTGTGILSYSDTDNPYHPYIYTTDSDNDVRLGLLDFNGDGYQDIFRTSPVISILLWQPENETFGTWFPGATVLTTNLGSEYYYEPIHWDPDTRVDYARIGRGVVDRDVLSIGRSELISPKPHNVVTKIINGLGAETDIHYENLSGTDHYSRIEGINSEEYTATVYRGGQETIISRPIANADDFYRTINDPFGYLSEDSVRLSLEETSPVLELFGAIPVVTRIESSSPSVVGNAQTNEYTVNNNAKAAIEYYYEQAKLQAGGRGMLGFKSLTTIDLQSVSEAEQAVRTTTYYRQDWPFIGQPIMTETHVVHSDVLGEGRLLKRSISEMGLQVPYAEDCASLSDSGEPTFDCEGSKGWGSVQPYLKKSIEQSFDLAAALDADSTNDGPLSTTIVENQYDHWGNPTRITNQQFAGEADSSDNWQLQTVTVNTYSDSGYDSTHGSQASAQDGRVTLTNVTTTKKNSSGAQLDKKYRRSSFDYDDANGLLKQEIIHYLQDSCSASEASGCGENSQLRLTTNYQYDPWANVIETKQSGWDGMVDRERIASSTYDGQGRYIHQTFNYYGQVTSEVISRNKFGAPTQVEDIHGTWAKTAYTDMGRPYWQASEVGDKNYTYLDSSPGQCPLGTAYRRITQGIDLAESQECYDKLGRTTRTLSKAFDGNNWIVRDIEYDLLGRIARQSELYHYIDGPTYWTRFEYDLLGRVTKTHFPDNSKNTVQYHGFTTTTINDAGNTHSETVDALGNIVEVRENSEINDVTSTDARYEYDALGNLIEMHSHPRSGDTVSTLITTVLSYDSLGRKRSMDDPDKGQWRYEYNAFGELIHQTSANQQDPNHPTTTQRYDALGRLVQRTDYQFEGGLEGETFWTYNNAISGVGLSLLDNVEYQGGTYAATNALTDTPVPDYQQLYTYDGFGRISRTTTILGNNGELGSYSQANTYDEYGRPFQNFDIDYGSESTWNHRYGIQYRYNAYGYQVAVEDVRKDNSGLPLTVYQQIHTMNARGQILHETRAGTRTDYSYDPATGRLCHLNTRQTSSGPGTIDCAAMGVFGGTDDIQDLGYQWDTLGNLVQRWEYSGSKQLEESFGYDKLNRLTSAQVQGHSAVNVTYDSLGNIKTKTGVGTYSYGLNAGPHAVTGVDNGSQVTHYTYDANGNNLDGDDRTLHYSSFDKPYFIEKGSHETTFAYGPGRNRFLREDLNTANNTHTRTLYVAGNEYLADLNSGKLEVKRYIAGALHTIHLAQGGGTPPESLALIFTDHLGSTDVITDRNGNILQEQSFDPWGQRRNPLEWQALSNLLVDLSFVLQGFDHSGTTQGFTGHEMLDEVGIIHMNGRIYDAKLGRFLQADPFIQEPTLSQSLNRYSYTFNNPLNATDPTGYISLGNTLGLFAAAVVAISCPTCGAQVYATWVGGATAVGTYIETGSFSEAAFAGGMAATTAGIGGSIAGSGVELFGSEWLGQVAAQGMFGGITSVLQGGKFGHGFVSAAISTGLGGSSTFQGLHPALRIGIRAIVGGTLSEATGGKFANGAVTAAFTQATSIAAENSLSDMDPEGFDDGDMLVCIGDECGREAARIMAARNEQKRTPENTAINIDLEKDTLVVIDEKGNKLYSCRIVHGCEGFETRTGNFKAGNWQDDKTNAEYPIPHSEDNFANPYGPHFLKIMTKYGYYTSLGIHGTKGPKWSPVPNIPLLNPFIEFHSCSHGCVRVSNKDIQNLRKLLPNPEGIPINIE